MNYLGFQIHPPQQVLEARVIAEGVEASLLQPDKAIRDFSVGRCPSAIEGQD